jgi:hypothetical protein
MAKLMTSTFLALLPLADFRAAPKPAEEKKPVPTPRKKEPETKPEEEDQGTRPTPMAPSLHYNIQIHLPATKDVEVYNAIFKSLKEHLFEV